MWRQDVTRASCCTLSGEADYGQDTLGRTRFAWLTKYPPSKRPSTKAGLWAGWVGGIQALCSVGSGIKRGAQLRELSRLCLSALPLYLA